MSIENTPSVPSTTSITFTPEAYSQISSRAAALGLSPQAYILALQAVHSGRVPADTLDAISEIYRHDRDILKELAK